MIDLLLWIILVPCIFLLLSWIIKELKMGICRNDKRLDKKVVVITGGTSGIGYETALDLAKRGAEVVITGRDMNKGKNSLEKLKTLSGNDRIHLLELDLVDKKSIMEFVKQVKEICPKIHYLINNAGFMEAVEDTLISRRKIEFKRTLVGDDKWEKTMAANFYGHVIIIDELLENIIQSTMSHKDPARIINLSSIAHLASNLDFDNLDLNQDKVENYIPWVQYGNAKLAIILYSNELSRRFKKIKAKIETVSIHPGIVDTSFMRETNDSIVLFIFNAALKLIGKTSFQGCQSTIEAVVTDKNISGMYMSECRPSPLYLKSIIGDVKKEKKLYKFTRNYLNLNLKEE